MLNKDIMVSAVKNAAFMRHISMGDRHYMKVAAAAGDIKTFLELCRGQGYYCEILSGVGGFPVPPKGCARSFHNNLTPRLLKTPLEWGFVSHEEWWPGKQPKTSMVLDEMGLLSGTVLSWHQNGQLNTQGVYCNGRHQGTHTEWYPTGVIRRESKYDPQGYLLESVYFYSNGFVKKIVKEEKGMEYFKEEYQDGDYKLP